MSNRLTLTIFKGCTESDLRDVIATRAQELGARALWDSDDPAGLMLGIRSISDVHTVYFGYNRGICGFFKEVGKALQCPWMEARIQEGALWDYSLMRGDEDIHDFSTLPEYFNTDEERRNLYAPRPDELAAVWGVPRERIERYVAWWGQEITGTEKLPPGFTIVHLNPQAHKTEILDEVQTYRTKLTGKAYPDDQFDYGDCWQLLDFIRALGGDMPPTHRPGEVWEDRP